VKSPKFEQLLDLATKASSAKDTEQAQFYIREAEKEFKRVHGISDGQGGGEQSKSFFQFLLDPKNLTFMIDGQTAQGVNAIGTSILGDIPKAVATWATQEHESSFGPPGEFNEATKLQLQSIAEAWKVEADLPSTTPERRAEIARLARQVDAAMRAGNTGEVMRLVRGQQ
jgi:hypothetical protein